MEVIVEREKILQQLSSISLGVDFLIRELQKDPEIFNVLKEVEKSCGTLSEREIDIAIKTRTITKRICTEGR
jgi:hypothetical protein